MRKPAGIKDLYFIIEDFYYAAGETGIVPVHYGVDDYFPQGVQRVIPALIALRLAGDDIFLVEMLENKVKYGVHLGEQVGLCPVAVLYKGRGLEAAEFHGSEKGFPLEEKQVAGP